MSEIYRSEASRIFQILFYRSSLIGKYRQIKNICKLTGFIVYMMLHKILGQAYNTRFRVKGTGTELIFC